MKKQFKTLIAKAEKLGWTVTEESENIFLFSKYSPAGQDFNVSVDSENDVDLFINNIYARYEDFDCSEETYLWLDNTGHGTNDAPYDMKDLYEDMESCQEMILELYNELSN
jgi:predicted heme/steroid binding protein